MTVKSNYLSMFLFYGAIWDDSFVVRCCELYEGCCGFCAEWWGAVSFVLYGGMLWTLCCKVR